MYHRIHCCCSQIWVVLSPSVNTGIRVASLLFSSQQKPRPYCSQLLSLNCLRLSSSVFTHTLLQIYQSAPLWHYFYVIDQRAQEDQSPAPSWQQHLFSFTICCFLKCHPLLYVSWLQCKVQHPFVPTPLWMSDCYSVRTPFTCASRLFLWSGALFSVRLYTFL